MPYYYPRHLVAGGVTYLPYTYADMLLTLYSCSSSFCRLAVGGDDNIRDVNMTKPWY